MEVRDLDARLDGARHSAFRLETLSTYLVPLEDEDYVAWRNGRRMPLRTPETSDWLAKVRSRTEAGFRWSRVHVVDWPLADYIRYELYAYQANAAAGEDVRIADRHAHPELEGLRRDFWLIDDEIAVWMHYDTDGHFLRPEQAGAEETEQCRRMRQTALTHAEPLATYLARALPELVVDPGDSQGGPQQ